MNISLAVNFLIHFKELNYRIIYYIISFLFTFCICFFFRVELFFLIAHIFLNYEHGFIYTNLFDPLIIYLKLSLFFAFIFTLPFFLYLFVFFFLRSLFTFYTTYSCFYLFSLYFLVIILFIMLLLLILPIIIVFLLNFQRLNSLDTLELTLQATIIQYYNFFFNYIKIYILLITIPNLFFVLVLLKIIIKDVFLNYKFRKYLYLIVFVFFIFFAPPDLLLQLFILPLLFFILEIFIYFISYLLVLYYLF